MKNDPVQNNIHEEGLDIKKIVIKIFLHWYLFVIAITIAYSITYFINRYSNPVYQISSSILIREKGSNVGSVENIIEDLGFRAPRVKKEIENEIGILKSYSLSKKAIAELDFQISYFSIGDIKISELYGDALFFRVILDTSHIQLLEHKVYINILAADKYRLTINDDLNISKVLKFGQSFENEMFKFKLILNSKKFNHENISNYDNGFYFFINDLHSVINEYRGKFTIELIEKKATFLVLISYGNVPQKEANYLNKLGEVYLRLELEEKNMASINTIKFIDGQLLGIVDSLRNTENILQDFRLNNKAIIDISQEGQMLFEKMEAFQVEKAMLNIKARYYDYLIEYAEQKRVFSDVMAPSAIGIENHVLTSLVEQLLELNTEINVMSYSVKENNPAYNVITVKINSAYEALLENLKNSIKETKLSLDDVDERISILESEINKLPVTERQLINLQRKFKINDQIYTYLLQKRAEAGITQASNIADNKIIDPAMPEDAVIISPEEEKNYMIAIFAGIIIPLLLIFIRYYFNTKITEKKDIESVTNVPVLGIIGHENEQNRLVIAHRPKSMISESFRIFRSNIQYILKDPDKKIISITSPVSGEGKTFIASNLASVIALAGKKTLLVALDMRRPQIHYELEMENHIGISSYLIAKTSYEEIVTKTHIDNLYLVAAGPIPPNPSELIETERMKQFINKAKEKFDYIIIDTPPIALVADALLISKYTDANIFVIRHNYTRKSMLGIINELYEKQKLNGMGIVLNDLFRKRMNEYYGYGHYNYGYAGYRYGYGKRNEYYYYDDEKPVNGIIGKIINSVFSKIKSRL